MNRVVIIDDEPLARSLVREYLAGSGHPFEVVAECDDGFEGIKAIIKHKPDLVILDIRMPRISGLEMLEALENCPDVIFATAFDEYAIQAFDRNAVDYLLKPFTQERFNDAIGKWLRRRGDTRSVEAMLNDVPGDAADLTRIIVRNGSEISMVPVNEIVYIEAFDDYVKIFTPDTFYLKKKTMAFYEKKLNAESFMRIHRSFIINLRFLVRLEPMKKDTYIAVMKGGRKVSLSRGGYARLRDHWK